MLLRLPRPGGVQLYFKATCLTRGHVVTSLLSLSLFSNHKMEAILYLSRFYNENGNVDKNVFICSYLIHSNVKILTYIRWILNDRDSKEMYNSVSILRSKKHSNKYPVKQCLIGRRLHVIHILKSFIFWGSTNCNCNCNCRVIVEVSYEMTNSSATLRTFLHRSEALTDLKKKCNLPRDLRFNFSFSWGLSDEKTRARVNRGFLLSEARSGSL